MVYGLLGSVKEEFLREINVLPNAAGDVGGGAIACNTMESDTYEIRP